MNNSLEPKISTSKIEDKRAASFVSTITIAFIPSANNIKFCNCSSTKDIPYTTKQTWRHNYIAYKEYKTYKKNV